MKTTNTLHRLLETKVLQNFSYLTLLNVFSALTGVLVYPYLIRILGAEQYGLYAFMLAALMYFQDFVSFGFDAVAAKEVSLNRENPDMLNRVVSKVYICKTVLMVLASVVALVGCAFVPISLPKKILFLVVYVQITYTWLFPQWYYQGMKNMGVSSVVLCLVRLLQLPLTVWLVQSEEDLLVYAAIVGGTMLAGGLTGTILLFGEGRRFIAVKSAELLQLYRDGLPFFLTNLTGSLKEKGLVNIIGAAIGMKEVALYDLAMKVVQIPYLALNSVNTALFPEVVVNATRARVDKVLNYERKIGILAMIVLWMLCYPAVRVLGGQAMLAAVVPTLLLSSLLYSRLLSNAYQQFVFIAQGRYQMVAWNQLVAMVSSLLLCATGLYFWPSATTAAAALSLAGFVEILFCRLMR